MTPQERFVAAVAEILSQIDRLPDVVVLTMLQDLEAARVQVLGEIAAAAPDGFQAYRLRELERRIQDVMARFVERYQGTLRTPQEVLFEAGQALAGRPLLESGITFAIPQVGRRQFEAARAFQALLITNATAETIGRISADLRLGILRGESVPEVLQRVGGRLQDPGPFGSLATRAEAITRTELGRIQAIATQAGLEEAQRLVPDLRKEWRHSGNTGPYRRLGHVEADGQVREVGEAFRVRPALGTPYEALMFPRDPSASPASTIFCGCQSVPFREEWREAIQAARREDEAFVRRRQEAAAA
jgi:hypothetical protein